MPTTIDLGVIGTFDIPDPYTAAQVSLAVAKEFGYQETILDGIGTPIANPQTPLNYTRQYLMGVVKRNINRKLVGDAIEAARGTVDTSDLDTSIDSQL